MEKSPEAFRTISEVADWLGTPAHVLRFWESKFAQVKPIKRAGGRRYYRPSDMALLGGLKKLLHEDGLSIKGAQALLREQGVKHVAAMSQPVDDFAEDVVEATPEPIPEVPRKIEGVPPLVLRRVEFEQEAAREDVPSRDLDEYEDEGPQPQLPFLHRPFADKTPEREPMLRKASAALDSHAETAPAAEAIAEPQPEPLAVAKLLELRRAVRGGLTADLRQDLGPKLEALRDRMSADRTA